MSPRVLIIGGTNVAALRGYRFAAADKYPQGVEKRTFRATAPTEEGVSS